MRMQSLRAVSVAVLVAAASLVLRGSDAETPAGNSRFTTLPGFVVEQVTPEANTADSYVNTTFDSLGRPVVSKEGDGPRTLLDTDGDGVFESERVFSDRVKDCQGLWFEARALYAVCVEFYQSFEYPKAFSTTSSRPTGRAGGCSAQRSRPTARPTRCGRTGRSSFTANRSTSLISRSAPTA